MTFEVVFELWTLCSGASGVVNSGMARKRWETEL